MPYKNSKIYKKKVHSKERGKALEGEMRIANALLRKGKSEQSAYAIAKSRPKNTKLKAIKKGKKHGK